MLGAGNVSSIGPMDTLYKLFVEGQVVLLKMNPVNEYLGPLIDEMFEPLRSEAFFGSSTAAPPRVTTSARTVWSRRFTSPVPTRPTTPSSLASAKRAHAAKPSRDARNAKRLTCELGNVSPIIIVPGPWSQKDLDFHGVNLASTIVNNAGFNCAATAW